MNIRGIENFPEIPELLWVTDLRCIRDNIFLFVSKICGYLVPAHAL